MIMIWWHLHFQNNQAALEEPGTGSIHQYFHHFNRAGYRFYILYNRIHYKSARVLHSTKLGQISWDQMFSLKLWPEKEFLKLELGQKKGSRGNCPSFVESIKVNFYPNSNHIDLKNQNVEGGPMVNTNQTQREVNYLFWWGRWDAFC